MDNYDVSRGWFIVDWERLSDAGGVMAKHCILLKLYKW